MAGVIETCIVSAFPSNCDDLVDQPSSTVPIAYRLIAPVLALESKWRKPGSHHAFISTNVIGIGTDSAKMLAATKCSKRVSTVSLVSRRMLSCGVVEDDPEGVSATGTHAADAVPQIDAVAAAATLNRPVPDREDDAVASQERHDLRPGLHPRTLLCEDEFTARKIHAGFFQQDRNLERENVFAVNVLVQTVEITGGYWSSSGVGRFWPAA
jgi:hypothetical protein